jgi:hypothetical protein
MREKILVVALGGHVCNVVNIGRDFCTLFGLKLHTCGPVTLMMIPDVTSTAWASTFANPRREANLGRRGSFPFQGAKVIACEWQVEE